MSIKRHPAGKLFSAAVEHGGLVYVAGQVADDLTQGAKGQTEQVLKKIDAILAASGTSKSKILSANVWVTDIRNRALPGRRGPIPATCRRELQSRRSWRTRACWSRSW